MLPMYPAVLLVHSWLRWVVLLSGLFVVIRAVSGAIRHRPWGPADDRGVRLYSVSLDVQLLLGLVLYFLLSPITSAALSDFGAAFQSSGLRFWAVEHVFGMIVAVILTYRGKVRVRAIGDPVRKHRVAAVFFTLALVAILASIPWPGTPNARPLFRW
jgi:hypothetical protein